MPFVPGLCRILLKIYKFFSQKDAKKKKTGKDGDEAIGESIVKEPNDSGNWVLYSSGFASLIWYFKHI